MHVDHPHRPRREPEEDRRGVVHPVTVDERARLGLHAPDRTEEEGQEIDAMHGEVRDRPAASPARVLPPRPERRRIPRRELGPGEDRRPEPPLPDPPADRLVGGVEPHHEPDAELHPRRAAGPDHPLRLADGETHRLLEEDVLPRARRGEDLREMPVHRRRDVDRPDARVGQQAGVADVRRRPVLRPDPPRPPRVPALHRDQPRIPGGEDPLRNRPPVGDAGGAEDAPGQLSHHPNRLRARFRAPARARSFRPVRSSPRSNRAIPSESPHRF